MEHIIRNLPPTKSKKSEYTCQNRFSNEIIQKFTCLKNDATFQNNYTKLKSGINYETGRKIKIGASIYYSLKRKMENQHGYKLMSKYEELDKINIESYLSETEKIQKELDIKNIEVEKENLDIQKYNDTVYEIRKNIDKLEKWNEYVEFEGNKYGIPYVRNDKHCENDCMGEMKCVKHFCECNRCEKAWSDCGNRIQFSYRCEKCGYQTTPK